ncbi:tRNA pseudouridine(55) synthase TruB [Roseburia sp. 499]|uniref:tRNA pseudouridine(55) synthase TruB n=1 Tax=Roseburia sp. 499 TaxID=1261634 RepID=UPI000952EE0E|nr:tRNA pseudouridine(55) synthase TruB [Roseburia sp. 499]WVK71275.1 tRNA pseudouridine(55) synthase TruB [Roseburia sp. 499]
MISGIINVYKEKGYTSHDVVAKLRRILNQKKIGHTGTLDPDAEGVLPVCLGKATRVCDMLTEKDKVYEAVLLFGKKTDTQDTTGNVLEEKEVACTEEQVREVVKSFVGTYAQIPPMYSALKVNGKKLCDLARAGIEVERKPREVTIFSIDIEEIELPRVKMLVHCSKGTYIRTLCHDIGAKLGCGGCMESLLRTKVAQFTLEHSLRLNEIEEKVQKLRQETVQELTAESLGNIVTKTDEVFEGYPKLYAKEGVEKMLYNGNAMQPEWIEGWQDSLQQEKIRLYDQKQNFIGIYQYNNKYMDIRPIKIFME